MTFRVGQKVVCVDASGYKGLPWHDGSKLVKGSIYTVRACGLTLDGSPGLLLGEIKLVVTTNRVLVGRDCFYWAERFRPVVERRTDISFAHEILRKATKPARSPLVALHHL
jgi:hypothetical protein